MDSTLVFVFCWWEIIDFVNPFHDGSVNGFFDLLVGRVFRVLVRSGNAISTAFLDGVCWWDWWLFHIGKFALR